MKANKWLKTGTVVSAAVAVAGVAGAVLLAGSGRPADGSGDALAALSRVPAPEIPSVAARMVVAASSEARETRAVEVLRAANAIAGSAVLPHLVQAVSQSAPDVAATVAGEAVQMNPVNAGACAQAATAAAPTHTQAIVTRAIQNSPNSYSAVVLAASKAAPTRSDEVIGGLTAALPQVRSIVDRTVSSASVMPSVPVVLASVQESVATAAKAEMAAIKAQTLSPAATVYVPLVTPQQKGPSVTPITPPGTPPGQVGTGNTVPGSGGRTYST